jgi:hypothetical protein
MISRILLLTALLVTPLLRADDAQLFNTGIIIRFGFKAPLSAIGSFTSCWRWPSLAGLLPRFLRSVR